MRKVKFHPGIESLKISKVKFWAGILLGIGYAFSFYSILYMSRESIRLFSITDDYNLWIFTNEEVNFYNFFFAFLSLIIGQSICIQFWANRSRRFLNNHKQKLTTIINDQRFLIWYFLSWFSKLAFVFAFIFVVTLEGESVFSFYSEYIFIFILFLIVLFLQSWVTIRKVFKRNSLKWMVISFMIISILSLGGSQINLIDYEEFNNRTLNKNICNKFNIDLPQINITKNLVAPYLIQKIYFAETDSSSFPILVFNNDVIELDSLTNLIKATEKSFLNKRIINRLKYQLYIDKDIPMRHVRELTNELGKANIFKIGYSALPKKLEYKKSYYRNHSISHYIPNPLLEFHDEVGSQNKKVYLEILNQNVILIDGIISKASSLRSMVKEKIEIGEITELIIKFNESTKFESYLNVLSLSKETINELRNEYSLQKFNAEYEYLQIKDRFDISRKYPLMIIDSMEINNSNK